MVWMLKSLQLQFSSGNTAANYSFSVCMRQASLLSLPMVMLGLNAPQYGSDLELLEDHGASFSD